MHSLDSLIDEALSAKRANDLPRAIALFEQAIAIAPNDLRTLTGLAETYRMTGRTGNAIAINRRALELAPGNPIFLNNLGLSLRDARDFSAAVEMLELCVRARPDWVAPLSNLAGACLALGQVDRAADYAERALKLSPDDPRLIDSLARIREREGRLPEAIDCLQRAIQLNPAMARSMDALLYLVHFDDRANTLSIFEKHVEWRQTFADRLKPLIHPHQNDASPDRPLRIGYVSPDLRSHAVGSFMVPLLQNHNAESCEVFCYSNIPGGAKDDDVITSILRRSAREWREIYHLSDDDAAELVRRDQIDILVDLTMHMANNRLMLFARKPAPVQITYLAYMSTTGLDAIDYRISDSHIDPVENPDAGRYSEKTLRLPDSYWCYNPPAMPDVQPPPCLRNGAVTFGCLNNFGKFSPSVRQTWIELMQKTNHSRLILNVPEGRPRQRLRDEFASNSIQTDRLQFIAQQDFLSYCNMYHQIDIALDPFPFGGGTTTCDALWMGVPVITLTGETAVGRGTTSILMNIGLPELIAKSKDEYVAIVNALSSDMSKLAELRITMRERMGRSPLLDAPKFARNIETAYRSAWQAWSAKNRR